MPGALLDPQDSSELTATESFNFQPTSWVPKFRSITSRTRFVDLPSEFLATVLTGAVYTAPAIPGETATETQIEWSDGTVDVVQTASTDMERDPSGVEAQIEEYISELGGAVCPKFGQTCPVDATWANFHRSTKCTSADDVLTLLKSSERVMSAIPSRESTVLALRKWADLDDRMEFRCFIAGDVLVGVCQRTAESSVEYSDEDMDGIVSQITSWFEVQIAETFDGPDWYVMDVYIDRRRRIWVIDFALWGDTTDGLLFEWEELEQASWMDSQNRAQFRCAYRHAAIRPSRRMYDGLPLELRNPEAFSALAEAAQQLVSEGTERECNDEQTDDV